VTTLSDVLTTAQYERTQFYRCQTRSIGHHWDDCDSYWESSIGTPWTMRCPECTTEKRYVIGSRGQIVSGPRYIYPPGYKYGKGERPSQAEFRMMLLEQRMREARVARSKQRSKTA
jgi:hypothetical protein